MAAVTLINCFEIPAGQDDEFFALWQQVNTYMRTKTGYLGHKLHRALAPDASYRFVNVAQWESGADFRAAHDEGFRALVSQPVWAAFPYHPVLYEVVHEGRADTKLTGQRKYSIWRVSSPQDSIRRRAIAARSKPSRSTPKSGV